MKVVHLIIGMLVALGFLSAAIFLSNKVAVSAEAACATCRTVIYPNGGPIVNGCSRSSNSSRITGPRGCRATPKRCDTFGYGSCSG